MFTMYKNYLIFSSLAYLFVYFTLEPNSFLNYFFNNDGVPNYLIRKIFFCFGIFGVYLYFTI